MLLIAETEHVIVDVLVNVVRSISFHVTPNLHDGVASASHRYSGLVFWIPD